MKSATLFALLAIVGSSAAFTLSAGAQSVVEPQTEAQRCQYGTYINADGVRKCRRRPLGSFGGSH